MLDQAREHLLVRPVIEFTFVQGFKLAFEPSCEVWPDESFRHALYVPKCLGGREVGDDLLTAIFSNETGCDSARNDAGPCCGRTQALHLFQSCFDPEVGDKQIGPLHGLQQTDRHKQCRQFRVL